MENGVGGWLVAGRLVGVEGVSVAPEHYFGQKHKISCIHSIYMHMYSKNKKKM